MSEINYDLIPGWEALHAYRVAIYPTVLILVTDAEPGQVRSLVSAWSNLENPTVNLDEFVRSQGYFAVTAGDDHTGETIHI